MAIAYLRMRILFLKTPVATINRNDRLIAFGYHPGVLEAINFFMKNQQRS
jgi:hypothetical protein